jgi:hypothetical protein
MQVVKTFQLHRRESRIRNSNNICFLHGRSEQGNVRRNQEVFK